MVIFLVIIGLMAGIALASNLYEKRLGTSRAGGSNVTDKHRDDASASEEQDDFGAGAYGD